jgi:hypothetical protein
MSSRTGGKMKRKNDEPTLLALVWDKMVSVDWGDVLLKGMAIACVIIAFAALAVAVSSDCDYTCKLDRAVEYTAQCNEGEMFSPDECREIAIMEVFGCEQEAE